jgi:hypothetical protein
MGAVGIARQGHSVALSADGNSAIVGGPYDNSYIGAAWVYSRVGTVWSQRGNKLVGTARVDAPSKASPLRSPPTAARPSRAGLPTTGSPARRGSTPAAAVSGSQLPLRRWDSEVIRTAAPQNRIEARGFSRGTGSRRGHTQDEGATCRTGRHCRTVPGCAVASPARMRPVNHPLHLIDPAEVGAADQEPRRTVADSLPARGVDRRLPGGARRVAGPTFPTRRRK